MDVFQLKEKLDSYKSAVKAIKLPSCEDPCSKFSKEFFEAAVSMLGYVGRKYQDFFQGEWTTNFKLSEGKESRAEQASFLFNSVNEHKKLEKVMKIIIIIILRVTKDMWAVKKPK